MEQFEALSKRLSSSLEAKIAAALTASTNLPRMVPQNFNDNKKSKDTSVGGSVLADGAQRGVTNDGRLGLPNVYWLFQGRQKE